MTQTSPPATEEKEEASIIIALNKHLFEKDMHKRMDLKILDKTLLKRGRQPWKLKMSSWIQKNID